MTTDTPITLITAIFNETGRGKWRTVYLKEITSSSGWFHWYFPSVWRCRGKQWLAFFLQLFRCTSKNIYNASTLSLSLSPYISSQGMSSLPRCLQSDLPHSPLRLESSCVLVLSWSDPYQDTSPNEEQILKRLENGEIPNVSIVMVCYMCMHVCVLFKKHLIISLCLSLSFLFYMLQYCVDDTKMLQQKRKWKWGLLHNNQWWQNHRKRHLSLLKQNNKQVMYMYYASRYKKLYVLYCTLAIMACMKSL